MAPAKKTSAKKVVKKAASSKAAQLPKKAEAKSAPKKDLVKKTKVEKKPAVKKVVTKAAPKSKGKTVAKSVEKKVETKKTKTTVSMSSTAPSKKKIAVPKVPDVFRCPISGMPVKAEKPNLTEKTLSKLKELLIEERVRHLAQADELAQEAVDLITDREAGDTQFDEESGEGDSVAVERERSLFLSAEAHNTVKKIYRALERMKVGS